MAVPIIEIENARGEVLNLSTDPRYVPILTGTGPPTATINRSKSAGADGTKYNSSTVDERPLELTIYLKRDIARARLNLYKYILPKEYIKIRYQADGLDVWIDGYVESQEVDPWTLNQNMQVAIVCPDPYWKDTQQTVTDASIVTALFELPFAIGDEGAELSSVAHNASTAVTNAGQVETGLIFELRATLRTLQPRIYNLETGEHIGFYVDLLAGERLVVNTSKGSKSITHIAVDGTTTDFINTFMEDSTWLKLQPGTSEYYYTVDEGEAELTIYHTNRYLGV